MNDVGAFKGAAKFLILGGQGDGVAIDGEYQLGIGERHLAGGETVGQHHAGQIGARQASGLDATDQHFGIDVVGRCFRCPANLESGRNIGG